ncbi:MAG: hypothetical protein ACPG4N_01335 [Gammaproteobacteria bacterium]
MLFGLIKQASPVDEDIATWLLDAFSWVLNHADGQYFREETRLILPSNADFPGRADSVHGMAELIFGHICRYAGMAHWPVRLAEPGSCGVAAWPTLRIVGRLRGDGGSVVAEPADALVELGYDPELVGNPEPMIASLAHGLAGVLVAAVPEPLPGGRENWPYVSEVMAVAMGFGVMLANSAKTMQVRSCASCGPTSQRTSYLSEFDITYLLAIFCVLKGIPAKSVSPHLKSHLRGLFKQSIKDISKRGVSLDSMKLLPA